MKDNEVTDKFSWQQATWMAKLSMHSYQNEAGFNKAIKPTRWKVKFFNFGGTQAYILSGTKNLILVFRGTEPTQWTDIKADLKSMPFVIRLGLIQFESRHW